MTRTLYCRGTDLAARIGGEEFAILLPGSDVAGAVTFAEYLRADIRREVVVEGVRWPTTASFGVAGFSDGDVDRNAGRSRRQSSQPGKS